MKKLLFILLFSPIFCFGQDANPTKQDSVDSTQTKILNQEMLMKNLEAKPTLELTKQVSMLQNEVQFLQNQQRQIIQSMDKTQKNYYMGIAMAVAGSLISSMAVAQDPYEPGPLLLVGSFTSIGGVITSLFSFRQLSKSKTSIRRLTLN
jgi:hypothetical protein